MISINGCVLTKLQFTTALNQKKSRQVTVISINAISPMSNKPPAVIIPVPNGKTMRLHNSMKVTTSRTPFKSIDIKTYTQVSHLVDTKKYNSTWKFIILYLEQGIHQYNPIIFSHKVIATSTGYLSITKPRVNATVHIINGKHTTLDKHAIIENVQPMSFSIQGFSICRINNIKKLCIKGKVPNDVLLTTFN